jgi:bacillithiol system protein YtxJ
VSVGKLFQRLGIVVADRNQPISFTRHVFKMSLQLDQLRAAVWSPIGRAEKHQHGALRPSDRRKCLRLAILVHQTELQGFGAYLRSKCVHVHHLLSLLSDGLRQCHRENDGNRRGANTKSLTICHPFLYSVYPRQEVTRFDCGQKPTMGRMTNPLQELTSIEDFDLAVAASATRPILIYKHSTTCGTSAMAFEEVTDLLQGPPLSVDVYLVRIQTSRAVSRAVETTLQVRHESPQMLLVSNGQVLWHGSHYRVTAKSIQAALVQHLTVVSTGA